MAAEAADSRFPFSMVDAQIYTTPNSQALEDLAI